MADSYFWGEDWATAVRLAARGYCATEIAAEIHRSVHAIRKKFEANNIPLPQAKRGPPPKAARLSAQHHVTSTTRISPDVLAQREARYAAAATSTLTQSVFGDPPTGFSALDRKRQEARS